MLEYGKIAKDPYHLNKNKDEGQTNWQKIFGPILTGISAYGDYQQIPDYDASRLQQTIGPLEESYENLMKLSEGYADPSSEINQRMRDQIRGQNLTGFTDIARRERSQSLGTGGDDNIQRGVDSNVLSEAIAAALQHHTSSYADRLKTSADLGYKASSVGNILSQARRGNYLAEMQRKQGIGKFTTDISQNIFDQLFPGPPQ